MDGHGRRQEASFGQIHFGKAELGDARRTKRLIKTADKLMEHPGGTLPEKLGGWADLIGLYRLVAAREMTHEAVIQSHCQRTLQLAAASGQVVLLIHDSTELDYTHVPALDEQLGQIGNGHGRGYVCHNTLAVTAQREVLGLASQVLHRRREVPRGETAREKREHPQRESLLWLKGCQRTGAVPSGCRWIDIADRGCDTFEFLQYEQEHGRQYVIRSVRNRRLAGEDHVACDRIHQTLHAHTGGLPDLGEQTITVPRQQKGKHRAARKTRAARVRIAAGAVSIRLPDFARGHCSLQSLDLWVVHVREIDPPAGVEPLEWVLLSNVPTASLAQALERIEWYRCRPMVEELHKGRKTGCSVESMQFQDIERLEPVIGLLSVVAAVLLQLREVARNREAQEMPSLTIVPRLFVQVLSGWRYQRARDDLSVYEFAMALARLGGHLNRKGDGFPGWLTLWRGWEDLQLMVRGAEAIKCV